MKGYKILTATLSTIVLCTGFQANAVVYEKKNVDIATGTVEVSGKLETFDADKALLTTVTLENSNFSKEGIIYNNEETVDSDGNFIIKFRVNNDTVESGNYLMYLSGEGMETIETPLRILYYTPKSLTEILNNDEGIQPENVSKEAIENFLNNNGDKFQLNNFTPYTVIAKSELAEAIADEIKENSEIISSAESFITYIQETTFVMAFNQNKIDSVFENSTEFCLDFSEFDKLINMDCTGVFKDELTDNGRKNVLAAVTGKDFNSMGEWYDVFSEACFVNVISNNKALGYEYVNKYLVGNKFGVNTSEYEALGIKTDNADRYIVANASRIVNLKSFESVLAEAVEKVKKEMSSNTGSMGGGGSSGGGFSGTTIKPGSSVGIVPPGSGTGKGMFSDLDTVPWAEDAISALAKKSILNGKGNGKFDPEGNVTREEFAKLVVNMFNITAKSDSEPAFTDVAQGQWYESYVNTAVASGIVTGYGDGRFGVGDSITRQDCTVMLLRALKYIQRNTATEKTTAFADMDEIDDYAVDAVKVLSGMGIVNGKGDNLFIPKAFCSRAEAAVMLYRLMNQGGDKI